MKIQEIKAAYQALDPDDEPMLQQFIHTYGTDARSGVQTLVEQTKKKLVQLEAEYVRSEKMLAFERKYHAMGSRYICGIDEVGRGPLAGPVVACAVILPEDEMLLHLNDSKQVPRKKREILYDIIREKAVAYGIGVVSEKRIDEINILQATYEAMRMAIANLKVQPDLLLNDAVRIPEVDIKQVPIIKGDTLSASIALFFTFPFTFSPPPVIKKSLKPSLIATSYRLCSHTTVALTLVISPSVRFVK